MGLDFVERFFKLTLDNVYRFACSLLFVVALLAWGRTEYKSKIEQLAESSAGSSGILSPVEQLAELLNWLAIPSAWLVPVGDWLTDRDTVIGAVATMILMVAVAFAAANDWRSRSGSTALFSIVILIQVGQFARILTNVVIILAVFVLITWLVTFLASRMGWSKPGWTRMAWEKIANVGITLVLAAAYLLSPLGWLISQESHNLRGTSWNPLYIKQIEQRGPTGAVR
ncbi:MAG: hypothetical protein ACTH8F_17285 [Microbacterium sp.]|uniref:hypothetical protein n=1 Tax=Microbacterium sp. TaxID=51671 RepID=UPI003F96FFEE